MNIINWNKETKQAYVGTLLYSLFGIAAAILSPFVFIGRVARLLSDNGPGFVGILYSIIEIIIICGYFIFFLAIKDLKQIKDNEEKNAFNQIYLSIIFDIIGAILGVFHIGILSGIFGLISCIFLINAYSSLKGSYTINQMSPSATSGFSLLFAAEILILVAISIGWIPVIKVIGSVLKAISWFLVLIGWKKVAKQVLTPELDSVKDESVLNIVKDVLTESIDDAKAMARETTRKSKIIAEEIEAMSKAAKENIKGRLENDDSQEG